MALIDTYAPNAASDPRLSCLVTKLKNEQDKLDNALWNGVDKQTIEALTSSVASLKQRHLDGHLYEPLF